MSEMSETFNLWDKVTLRPAKLRDQATDALPTNADDLLIKQGLIETNYPAKEITEKTIQKIKRKLAQIKADNSRSVEQGNIISVEQIISIAESAVEQELKEIRQPGNRLGACGFCSSLVSVVAESCGYEASIYQIYKLNELRGVGQVQV